MREFQIVRTPTLIPQEKDRSGEFVISLNDTPVEGSREFRLGTVHVHVFPKLPVVRLLDEGGSTIGVFLGHVVDYRAQRILDDTIQFRGRSEAACRTEDLEDLIYSFGGRWVFLRVEKLTQRLYLDADGSNSVVFDPVLQRAASTTGLLLDDDEYVRRFDYELHDTLDVSRDGWFPSGLTAHVGVSRLLCNHALDLASWETSRHWPRSDFQWTTDTRGHAERIGAIASGGFGALLSAGSVAVSLTAGNETRFLLAAARPHVSELEFVTTDVPSAALDVHRAEELAERFGLRHSLIPQRKASTDQMLAWQYRVGHAVGGNNMHFHPSIDPLRSFDFFVGGLGGEIGRAFFWRPHDDERTEVDARSITARFGMPQHEAVVSATERWLETVRDFNPLTKIDLAYLELRMSAWAFAQSYAQDAIVNHIHPMITRESFQLMLELAPSAKRDSLFITEGIAAMWPELLDLPINRYGDHRDVVALARKLTTPSRVIRRARRLFG